jgi:isoquinoline 1-oxidoreductase beta subunit
MGTGIRTSLPLVAADELDATWSARIEQGGDPRYGDQNTDGSRSIRDTTRFESPAPRRSRC